MRAVMLAMLVACGTDEPANVCTEAIDAHLEMGCSFGSIPRHYQIETCHMVEAAIGCDVEFDAVIECWTRDRRAPGPECECTQVAGAANDCAGVTR